MKFLEGVGVDKKLLSDFWTYA